MSTEHIETVLSTAYHLTKQGRACVVLDSNARIGDNWRRHWDTMRLYSPAKDDTRQSVLAHGVRHSIHHFVRRPHSPRR